MREEYALPELVDEYRHIGCPHPDVAAPRLGLRPEHLRKRLTEARRAGLLPPVDNLPAYRAAP